MTWARPTPARGSHPTAGGCSVPPRKWGGPTSIHCSVSLIHNENSRVNFRQLLQFFLINDNKEVILGECKTASEMV